MATENFEERIERYRTKQRVVKNVSFKASLLNYLLILLFFQIIVLDGFFPTLDLVVRQIAIKTGEPVISYPINAEKRYRRNQKYSEDLYLRYDDGELRVTSVPILTASVDAFLNSPWLQLYRVKGFPYFRALENDGGYSKQALKTLAAEWILMIVFTATAFVYFHFYQRPRITRLMVKGTPVSGMLRKKFLSYKIEYHYQGKFYRKTVNLCFSCLYEGKAIVFVDPLKPERFALEVHGELA